MPLVSRSRSSTRSTAGKQEKVKSKVVILLTDGDNNAGDVDPVQAAELAKTMGVKIYTIGVGTRGRAPVPMRNPFTGRQEIEWAEVNIDEDTLQKIAAATGGKYFRATNTESLAAIYREIDQLEKTKVEARHFIGLPRAGDPADRKRARGGFRRSCWWCWCCCRHVWF